jgi:ketosteroid isomerase-like protein
MAAGKPGSGHPASQVARAALAAIAEGRVADLMALTDPQVVVMPTTRPGLSVYDGHAAVAELVEDLRAAWGKYRLVVTDAGTRAGSAGDVVTLRLRVVESEREGTEWPPVLAEFTVRDGLVTLIESRYED